MIAMLPWWIGLALALVSYVVLHHLAGQPATAPAQPGQLGTMVAQTLGRTLASIGQYVLPVICLAGAGVSAWRRHERKRLVEDVANGGAPDVLDGMSWQQFERLVGEAFRLQGYRVAESGGGGADGGVDLVLRRDGEKFLVQCKQWRAFRVGVDVVRELYGVMAAKGATGGFVVTSGRFTEEAINFASGRNVKLIDGSKLYGLIQQAKAGGRPAPSSNPESTVTPLERPTSSALPPNCPLCSKPMVRRTAGRGTKAGEQFWGCTGFPSCRGTRTAA